MKRVETTADTLWSTDLSRDMHPVFNQNGDKGEGKLDKCAKRQQKSAGKKAAKAKGRRRRLESALLLLRLTRAYTSHWKPALGVIAINVSYVLRSVSMESARFEKKVTTKTNFLISSRTHKGKYGRLTMHIA